MSGQKRAGEGREGLGIGSNAGSPGVRGHIFRQVAHDGQSIAVSERLSELKDNNSKYRRDDEGVKGGETAHRANVRYAEMGSAKSP